MEEKLVIYTAIIGNKDKLHEPRHRLSGVDYVCFTDNPELRSDIFTIRPAPFMQDHPQKTARQIKIYPHVLFPQHRKSIWMDSSHRIISDLTGLLDIVFRNGRIMTAFNHPERDCVYEEIDTCLKLGRDAPHLLQKQKEAYMARGIPAHAGLFSTGVLFRCHDAPQFDQMMALWWKHLQLFSLRDQIALPAVLFEMGHRVESLAWEPLRDRHFIHYRHLWHREGDSRNQWRQKLKSDAILWLKRLGCYAFLRKIYQRLKTLTGPQGRV